MLYEMWLFIYGCAIVSGLITFCAFFWGYYLGKCVVYRQWTDDIDDERSRFRNKVNELIEYAKSTTTHKRGTATAWEERYFPHIKNRVTPE